MATAVYIYRRVVIEPIKNNLFMRGSIEMNTLKQIASRALVFVLALSILVPALIVAGDNNVVQAEKLASVYLTNKGTAKTTESSPPTARANPASRSTVSTLYATMTDVDTTNATQNSHILDSNKIVITVDEADFNTKVNIVSGVNDHQAAAVAANSTIVVTGLSNNPVIDSDSDGDLTDEVYYKTYANGATACAFTGTAVACTGTARTLVLQTVSVANGAAATAAVAPMITAIVTTADGNSANGDDIFTGYYSSAVNTFQVNAWSTVQLESNASVISVVETGRNTGIFEAEFVIADTEGANDNVNATTLVFDTNGANTAADGGRCDAGGVNAAVANDAGGPGTMADGRFDRSGGVDADCEILTIVMNDVAATAKDASIALTTGAAVPAGQKIWDVDGDGSILDEHFFSVQSTEALAAANRGYSVDGAMEATALTCGGAAANCTNGIGGAVVLTVTLDGAAITNGTDDLVVSVPLKNNVVDNAKVAGNAAGVIGNTVSNTDLKSNRPGSDTISGGGGTVTSNTNVKTAVPTLGMDRTPVVEAQANSTITVQYKDLTDNNTGTSATVGTKIKATATIDTAAPTPLVTTPTSGSSFKDRQPSFSGSASDIGSGLDVSTIKIYVDVLDPAGGADATLALGTTAGSWLGGAGSINLGDEYRQVSTTLDNTTTMVDGVTSATWTVTTSTNIPCLTVNNDGSTPNSDGGGSHTNFANIATDCATAKSEPDVSLDYFSSATDLAGNRGFSDATTTDTNDGPSFKDNYSVNIDELKPSLDSTNTETGVYWNAATTAEKTGDATRIVVAFDDEISAAPASSFEVTTDAGTVLTPIATEVGTKGTTAAGVAYDKRQDVYLTLGTALATSETPKVKLVGNVTDLAGNTNKSGNVANAVDRIKPSLTLALSGGSGTGSSPDDSLGLTKKAMTFTITTSEVLSGVPTVSIFAEDYGKGSTFAAIGDGDGSAVVDASGGATNSGNIAVGLGAEMLNTDAAITAGNTGTITITGDAVIDSDRDGSLTDEVTLGASPDAATVSSQQLTDLSVTSVTNNGNSTVTIVVTLAAGATTIPEDKTIKVSANHLVAAAGNGTTATIAEGTVTAVAVDATSYTATFDGSLATISDVAAKDSKAVIISAIDVNSNTGTLGTRDQSASSGLYKFRLDKTAPVLNNDPDGDGTVGSATTLPRPYVIFEFTDNSKVTVNSASFGGSDVLAKLATTNSKKYFMVPEADLTAGVNAVKAKGTDLAGNAGQEASYNMTVTSRKDYKATILAGWNLMSFPSDPVSNTVTSVFTNAGIDQVVGYDAMSKGSPWAVATKDSATGAFSGGLESVNAGNGYWVHSTEFSSQAVSLVGPEGPSASTPPSIEAIGLASGWNLIGVVDSTKAKTQANEGDVYKTVANYLGTGGGSSITKAFAYNTTSLAWSSVALNSGDVLIGGAYWVYAKPDANGMLTPIVP
jgi:hypothetical protein